jgi:ATP adenylyltransferase
LRVLHDERGADRGEKPARLLCSRLILPNRHIARYFDLDADEKGAINELLELSRVEILACDPTVAGFNIGINIGEAAGQTIFHCHVHMIPRRPGDIPSPRGGVRAVIPGKADY